MLLPHQIGLKLTPISKSQLSRIQKIQGELFIKNDNLFERIATANTVLDSKNLEKYIQNDLNEFFIESKDYDFIKDVFFRDLQETTRKLSVGDAKERGRDYVLILLENLSLLYHEHFDQQLLSLIYQTTPSYCSYLLHNKNLIPYFYKKIDRSQMHFIYKQPVLSSLFLLSFLFESLILNHKESQDLFILSLIKDLGMCFLPKSAWGKRNLDKFEQEALNLHAINSVQLLKDRLPLQLSALNLIENHHFYNDAVRDILTDQKEYLQNNLSQGIETSFIALSDLIVAMKSLRPYRSSYSNDIIIKVVSRLMRDQYKIEELALTRYIQHFFQKVQDAE